MKIKLLIALCILFAQTTFGQTYYNPTFDRRDFCYLDITKIDRDSNNTTVYFKFKASNSFQNEGWVCAGSSFFIRDTETKKKYKLIKANDIAVCSQVTNFKYSGQVLEFNLIFEPIPFTTSQIDIIESELLSKSYNFYGVKLSVNKDSSHTSIQDCDTQNISSVSSQENTPPALVNQDCDKINYSPISSKPSFQNMLAGVKYAVIVNRPKINGHVSAFNALYEYLQAMGFQSVKYFGDDYVQPKHLCEEVWVDISFDYNSYVFGNVRWYFYSPCNRGYEWVLSSDRIIRADRSEFYNVLREMYQYQKPTFNSYYRIELPKRQTCWTEAKLKSHIVANGCDRIEGIYENSFGSQNMAKYKVAVHKIEGVYYLIYLSGAQNSGNWKEGEIKAILEPTAIPNFYKAKWIMADKSENNDFYISFESVVMNVINHQKGKDLYIKLFPAASDNVQNPPSELAGSGTGWALSSDGYIVTNHHVTEGAKSIKIRGVNGDFSKAYSARVVIEDKKNDLAIIKIDDAAFTTLGTIPYTISTKVADVGENVFVLGYPLLATMGDEVKLTNGIISARTGFQGDVTSYQVSAPVQPGNSGGPLFDNKGNIIGIINAKHGGAESASYAVKSSYLINLIDLMPSPPKLQTVSSVTGKSLTEQVKVVRRFTYIIEVN